MSKVTIEKYEDSMTVKQVSEILGISEPSVRGKLLSGQIKFIEHSPRKWRITRDALEDYLTRSQSGASK